MCNVVNVVNSVLQRFRFRDSRWRLKTRNRSLTVKGENQRIANQLRSDIPIHMPKMIATISLANMLASGRMDVNLVSLDRLTFGRGDSFVSAARHDNRRTQSD